jgi:hypothetical protein
MDVFPVQEFFPCLSSERKVLSMADISPFISITGIYMQEIIISARTILLIFSQTSSLVDPRDVRLYCRKE